MREAMLSVSIKFRSSNECDPCVVGGEIKVSACPDRQVVNDRIKTEPSAVVSKIPTKAARRETNMSPRGK